MSITKQAIADLAKLSRLSISENEVEKYQLELNNIFKLVEQMETCDTSDVKPMTHPFDASLRLREDQVTEQDKRDQFQSIAPSSEKGLYKVPKVID